jgi:3-oxoacyl-[acyl-carrier protein] reductase
MGGPTTDAEIARLAKGARSRFVLSGKRVLVTGAANGLGRTMALAFAAAEAHVAVINRSKDRLEALAAYPGIKFSGSADISDPAVEAVTAQAINELGGLDILVNNAGEAGVGTITGGSADELTRFLEVNCGGSARMVRASVNALRASGAGRIINIATLAVFVAPSDMGCYVASKAAVIGLTRALATELGPERITVNAIAPGLFPTRAVAALPDEEAVYQWMLGSQAIKRLGSLDDIACAAMFLGSDASSFITGQTLIVDGGLRFI